MPWGTSSTSIVPALICSSLAVGVPGRTGNAAISFFTWLFSARIWPRVAPASPSELQTSVRSFVFWSRRAQIRAVAKRCATPKPAMATVAPSGMSATACSGDPTILFMQVSFPGVGGGLTHRLQICLAARLEQSAHGAVEVLHTETQELRDEVVGAAASGNAPGAGDRFHASLHHLLHVRMRRLAGVAHGL